MGSTDKEELSVERRGQKGKHGTDAHLGGDALSFLEAKEESVDVDWATVDGSGGTEESSMDSIKRDEMGPAVEFGANGEGVNHANQVEKGCAQQSFAAGTLQQEASCSVKGSPIHRRRCLGGGGRESDWCRSGVGIRRACP